MIGGRVLDTSALLAFATETSVYCSALVWTAVRESMVLAVPSTAVAAAWADLADKHYQVLEVLLSLHVTVIDPLDGERARDIDLLGGSQADAHAVACARERGMALGHRATGPVRGIRAHRHRTPALTDGPRHGSLASIHLVTADPFRTELTEFVTYDHELTKAAAGLGFPWGTVIAPLAPGRAARTLNREPPDQPHSAGLSGGRS